MRTTMIALAAATLAACDGTAGNSSTADAKPALLAFDGAGATDPAAIVRHGERLAEVLSCKGCHGDKLQGRNVTADDAPTGNMWAPNLTLLMASYSDPELDRAIRHGVPRDKREMWFMPSETYSHLSEADFAALVAYLRTVKPGGKPTPPISKGPQYLVDIAKGTIAASPAMVKRYQAAPPVDLGPSHALGRYLAMTTCTECHNSSLQGFDGFTPDLDIAGSYNSAELTALLTTGEGKVKKDLGLMSSTARVAYSKLTPKERAALVAYIKARVDRPQ